MVSATIMGDDDGKKVGTTGRRIAPPLISFSYMLYHGMFLVDKVIHKIIYDAWSEGLEI